MMATGEPVLELPFGFETWNPVLQVIFFWVTAMISEDATMISAAILSGTGQIHRMVAFLGAFLGIWIGDFLLFAIAWHLRSWAQTNERARRWMARKSFARYENWFSVKGWRVLVICRFLPGTRLSCFMSAGYLRMNPWVFGVTTFLCALFWALAIFAIFEQVGQAYREYLDSFYQAAWTMVGIVIGGVILLKLVVSLTQREGRRIWAVRIGKLTRWEFWPGWAFYTPPFIFYMVQALKHRSLTLPTLANPGIENGGFVGESKASILRMIEETGTPYSLPYALIPSGDEAGEEERLRHLTRWMEDASQTWPVILKPDLGQRGMGVRLVKSRDEARQYLLSNSSPVICQEPAKGQREAGIFYIRHPEQETGFIFAVTEKAFPVLTGNGTDSLRELIWKDERARFQHKVFFHRFADRLESVPADGEVIPLVFAGNHAQGSLFLNGNSWITDQLTRSVDELSQKIPGFYFGRYDIRFDSVEDLKLGQNFQIIELNGVSSEATNIYDPGGTLRNAWSTIFDQWTHAFRIGAYFRSHGMKPVPLAEWMKYYRDFRKKSDNYPGAD